MFRSSVSRKDIELLWSLDRCSSCCCCHAKSLCSPLLKKVSTRNLLIMTRCSCKTRGITLKVIFLELYPFLTKILNRMMAPNWWALVLHTVLFFVFATLAYNIGTVNIFFGWVLCQTNTVKVIWPLSTFTGGRRHWVPLPALYQAQAGAWVNKIF